MPTRGDWTCPCLSTLVRVSVGPLKNGLDDLLGVEYIAAIPARKSLASAFPPVADAEYGP